MQVCKFARPTSFTIVYDCVRPPCRGRGTTSTTTTRDSSRLPSSVGKFSKLVNLQQTCELAHSQPCSTLSNLHTCARADLPTCTIARLQTWRLARLNTCISPRRKSLRESSPSLPTTPEAYSYPHPAGPFMKLGAPPDKPAPSRS